MEIRELRELSEDYIAEMLTKLGLNQNKESQTFWGFGHHKTHKERISTESINYLI